MKTSNGQEHVNIRGKRSRRTRKKTFLISETKTNRELFFSFKRVILPCVGDIFNFSCRGIKKKTAGAEKPRLGNRSCCLS